MNEVHEHREEFYLSANLKEIFELVKIWSGHNGFKIKKETPTSYIKAKRGGIFKESTYYLEINLSSLPAGNFISIYEKVDTSRYHVPNNNIAKPDVLALTKFLKSSFTEDSPLEPDEKFCIHCGAKIRAVASFCDACGKKQDG